MRTPLTPLLQYACSLCGRLGGTRASARATQRQACQAMTQLAAAMMVAVGRVLMASPARQRMFPSGNCPGGLLLMLAHRGTQQHLQSECARMRAARPLQLFIAICCQDNLCW